MGRIFISNVLKLEGLLGSIKMDKWGLRELTSEVGHFKFALFSSDGANVNKRTCRLLTDELMEMKRFLAVNRSSVNLGVLYNLRCTPNAYY